MLLRSSHHIDGDELAFARLRYSLEGDRPSQTNKDTRSSGGFIPLELGSDRDRKVFHFREGEPANLPRLTLFLLSLLPYTGLALSPRHPFSKGA